jgi:hypothetical protein
MLLQSDPACIFVADPGFWLGFFLMFEVSSESFGAARCCTE